LIALIEGVDHVCYRYRLKAFLPELERHSIEVEPQPIVRGVLSRTRQLLRLRHADGTFVQRKLFSLPELLVLRAMTRRLIYDFDDAVFQRDSFAGKPPESYQRRGRFRATVKQADLVLGGNDYLCQQARRCAPAAKIVRIPTCVDPRLYSEAEHRRVGAKVELVWIGSRSTMASLMELGDHLRKAAAMIGSLTLKVVCDTLPEIPGIEVRACPWASETEAAELASADIGIAWLPADLWSLGKCGLKVLQYMAAALPVVANPVGVHGEMVRPGETGFLAETPEQWAEAIARLATDPACRRQMGTAARRKVQAEYSVNTWAPRLAGLITQTLQPKPNASKQT